MWPGVSRLGGGSFLERYGAFYKPAANIDKPPSVASWR
jgi:hypothetical protein